MKHNFKVGDKVICIPTKYIKGGTYGGVFYQEGLEFIIGKITVYGGNARDVLWPLENGRIGSTGVFHNSVKLVSSELQYEIY